MKKLTHHACISNEVVTQAYLALEDQQSDREITFVY